MNPEIDGNQISVFLLAFKLPFDVEKGSREYCTLHTDASVPLERLPMTLLLKRS
jgi:hypothetical protein